MHPIHGLMKETMENIKQMVDVNTIVSDPITLPDGGVVLAVSKVGVGFGAGGSDLSNTADLGTGENAPGFPFGGGSGGGISITPIAFLVVNNTGVSVMHLQQNTHLLEKVIDATPKTVKELQSLFQNASQQGNMTNTGMNDSNLD
ncbi:MAG: GerW family sporulation protein [Bacillaceae bacterium]